MVVPHSGGYPHAKFEGNLLLFKFEPHTKSGLTIPQCGRGLSALAGCKIISSMHGMLTQWRMASGTWFGETSRQSQAEPVKQQHTGISPNHVPEAVRYSHPGSAWL